MSERATNETKHLFDEAEHEGRCVHATSDRIARRLQRLARAGLLMRVRAGLFARTAYWDGLDEGERGRHVIRGLAAQDSDKVFCDVSAAIVWKIPVSWDALAIVHLATRQSSRSRNLPHTRRHVIRHDQLEYVDGVRVTSFEQTTVDCLCSMDFIDGLAVADHFLRCTGLTRGDLLEIVDDACRGRRGAKQARITASLADPRAESGGESIARAMMIRLGFMPPDLQKVIPDPIDTDRTYRLDFFWSLPDGRLIGGELDGRQKYLDVRLTYGTDPETIRERERIRESRITAHGVAMVRFRYADVLNVTYFKCLLEAYGIPRDVPPRTRPPSRNRRLRGIRTRVIRLGSYSISYCVKDAR